MSLTTGPFWFGGLMAGTLKAMNGTDDLLRCPKLIRRWARRWDTPELAKQITCEWSSRLRRSLGRAYPNRKLIRLSLLLKEPQHASLFEEVLCHEAAHIAAFLIHGNRATNHGLEWEELVRLAGYEPRSCCRIDALPERQDLGSVRYEHICPICQAKRTAKRPQPQWRCVACQNAGLEGELIIQSRPKLREALDV
ncbi:MAG: SprT-like domain-containing protein [Pirellulaceae bacterium]|nr:SprT-like domain-containing protein [Pirellulaceae bacterium]